MGGEGVVAHGGEQGGEGEGGEKLGENEGGGGGEAAGCGEVREVA